MTPQRVWARIESHVAGQRMSCGDPEVWQELLRGLAEGRNCERSGRVRVVSAQRGVNCVPMVADAIRELLVVRHRDLQLTVRHLLAVMAGVEFREACAVLHGHRAEDRSHPLAVRGGLAAGLLELVVRRLEANASLGRRRGSGRGLSRPLPASVHPPAACRPPNRAVLGGPT